MLLIKMLLHIKIHEYEYADSTSIHMHHRV
jgi:hypothetical protein